MGNLIVHLNTAHKTERLIKIQRMTLSIHQKEKHRGVLDLSSVPTVSRFQLCTELTYCT